MRPIRSLVPGALRRLRAFRGLVSGASHREVLGRLDATNGRLDHATSLLDDVRDQLLRTKQEVKVLRAHADLHFWATYRRDGEDVRDAKYRFFAALAPATGPDRAGQLDSARLLRQFADLCDTAGIGWWLKGGTLLGAHRHRGFIPWDDDIDVAIMAGDLRRLEAAVADGGQHCLTIRYDPGALCRQIRFAARGGRRGVFVDVFPYYPSTLNIDDCRDLYVAHRAELMRVLRTWPEHSRWVAAGDVAAGTELGRGAERLVDEAIVRFATAIYDADGAVDGSSARRGRTLVNGIESVTPDSVEDYPDPVALPSVFPLGTEWFEGEAYPAPADTPAWLVGEYADYLRVPFDIVDHYRHRP